MIFFIWFRLFLLPLTSSVFITNDMQVEDWRMRGKSVRGDILAAKVLNTLSDHLMNRKF